MLYVLHHEALTPAIFKIKRFNYLCRFVCVYFETNDNVFKEFHLRVDLWVDHKNEFVILIKII